MFKNLGAPVINTNRLYCRMIDLCDVNDMYEICSDQEVTKYLTFEPHINNRQTKRVITNMIRSYLADESINYAIILKETKKMIASMSITFFNDGGGEIGYLMNKKYWKNGYMFEAVEALIDVCFSTLHLRYLKLRHIIENFQSEKLIQKLGFNLNSIEYDSIIKQGVPFSTKSYLLTDYEYFNRKI